MYGSSLLDTRDRKDSPPRLATGATYALSEMLQLEATGEVDDTNLCDEGDLLEIGAKQCRPLLWPQTIPFSAPAIADEAEIHLMVEMPEMSMMRNNFDILSPLFGTS